MVVVAVVGAVLSTFKRRCASTLFSNRRASSTEDGAVAVAGNPAAEAAARWGGRVAAAVVEGVKAVSGGEGVGSGPVFEAAADVERNSLDTGLTEI